MRFTLLAAVVFAIFAVAACSAPQNQPVVLNMKEWSMQTSASSAQAGKITFEVTNKGSIAHEVVILKTDAAPGSLEMETDGSKVDEAAAGVQDLGEIEDIAPGETKNGTFDLPAGKYLLICNVPGHFQAGMSAAFTVK